MDEVEGRKRAREGRCLPSTTPTAILATSSESGTIYAVEMLIANALATNTDSMSRTILRATRRCGTIDAIKSIIADREHTREEAK